MSEGTGSMTARLLLETVQSSTSQLSPIEERLIAIALKLYTQMLGPACVARGISEPTAADLTEDVVIDALGMALRAAAKMEDTLRGLRDEIEKHHSESANGQYDSDSEEVR